jgi:WD40 repeat protein
VRGDGMIQSDAVVSSVGFLSDRRLAGACEDGKVRVWDVLSGELTRVVAQDAGDSAPLVVQAAGVWAAVGPDGAVKVRELKTGAVVRRQAGPKTKVRRLVSSRDGSSMAGFGPVAEKASEWSARLWDRAGQQRFVVPCGLGEVRATAIAPDGATLVAGSWDTDIRVWNTGHGELVARIEDIAVSMLAMDFSPDGKVLAAAGADRVVHLFDTKTWKVTRTLAGQPEAIASLAFSRDGRMLATGGVSVLPGRQAVQVIVWDVAAGKVIRTVSAPRAVWSVAFTDDGALLAHVTGEKTVALWSARG